MRQRAEKMCTSLALALLLTLSAFFAPLTAEIDHRGSPDMAAQHQTADAHNHTGVSSCHKIAACEVPVAMLPRDRVALAGAASNVTFSLNDRAPASMALEAPLPPPKVHTTGA